MMAHRQPMQVSGARAPFCHVATHKVQVRPACVAAHRRMEQQPSGPSQPSLEGVDVTGIMRVSVVAAVAMSLVVAPGAARAETRAWKPRRHYRRMDEFIGSNWAEEAVEMEERMREEAQQSSQQKLLFKRQQEEAEFQRMKKEQEQRVQKAEKILTQVEASRIKPIAIKVAGVDILPYLFWGAIAAFVFWASKSLLQRSQDQKRTGGKWVYDRSLGGKKVWVPDAATTSADASVRVRTEEFERLTLAAAAARQKLDKAAPGEFRLPAWWNLPPTSFASPDVKAAKQADADRLLTRIEQAKNRGEDYSIREILMLRTICQEGGVSVRTKTVGARDAIYQAAVDAAVTFAQDHSNIDNALGDQDSEFPESRLLTGLAGDLNLPEERAASIVRVSVAAACRARLLDAVKYLKESNEMDALVALMHLSSLLQHLPALSEGLVEPELIASSLSATSTLEDRQKIFYILGQLQVEGAALFAEMLGFEPALVVPKLYADVDAYRQQQQAAEAAKS